MTLVKRLVKGSALTHAEGDGNWDHVNPQGRQIFTISGAGLRDAITAGATPTAFETPTNGNIIEGLAFAAGVDQKAFLKIWPPKKVAVTDFLIQVAWTHAATATNFGTVWAFQALAVGAGDPLDAALSTSVGTTSAGGATGNDYPQYITPAVNVTPAGTWAKNDALTIAVRRNGSAGTDTLAVDAILTDVRIHFTVDAATDD